MRRIDGDVVRDQRAKPTVAMAGQRLRAAPEHAVVHEEQLRAGGDSAAHCFAREIDRGCDAVDRAGVRQLHAVHRGRIIRNRRDV